MRRKPYKPFVKKEFKPEKPYNAQAGLTPNLDFLNEEKHIFDAPIKKVDDSKKDEDI